MTAIVTAYCHCVACCGIAEGLTASDVLPVPGITVAAPRAIPFGTRVRITLKDGRSWVLVAQDRTHGRFDGRWDIFMPTHKEAVAFGIHTARVEILSGGIHDGAATRRAGTVPPKSTATATPSGTDSPRATAARGNVAGGRDRLPAPHHLSILRTPARPRSQASPVTPPTQRLNRRHLPRREKTTAA